jgi:hypothetical protein
VVAPPVTRNAWLIGAVLAAAALVALAAHGRRPDGGLVRFEAAGLLRGQSVTGARTIEVSDGTRCWRFERGDAEAWRLVAGPGTSAGAGDAITRGLRFLEVSPPQRVLSAEEVAAAHANDFGLDPPRYTVAIHGAPNGPFIVHFGGANAQGLAQYVRLDGHAEVVLLPRYVGEPWEAVLSAR